MNSWQERHRGKPTHNRVEQQVNQWKASTPEVDN